WCRRTSSRSPGATRTGGRAPRSGRSRSGCRRRRAGRGSRPRGASRAPRRPPPPRPRGARRRRARGGALDHAGAWAVGLYSSRPERNEEVEAHVSKIIPTGLGAFDDPTKDAVYWDAVEEATELLQEQRIPEAMVALRDVIKAQPNNPYAYNYLGV